MSDEYDDFDLFERLASSYNLCKERDIKYYRTKLLQKASASKINSNIMEHLASETELRKFLTAFSDAHHLQICFIVDITGSMAKYYDNFKNNELAALIDGVLRAVNQSKLNYAYIGYRERNEPYDFINFTDDLAQVTKAIRNADITGGDDGPEDVEFAFKTFIEEINFQPKGTRIIIHVADAPCHGSQYHNTEMKDDHPEWSDNIPKKLRIIANSLNCFYWFVKITNQTDTMIKEFDKILQEVCDTPGLNTINVIDLTKLKGDLAKQVQIFTQKTILAATAVKLD